MNVVREIGDLIAVLGSLALTAIGALMFFGVLDLPAGVEFRRAVIALLCMIWALALLPRRAS